MADKRRSVRRLTAKMRGNLCYVFLGILCLFLLLIGRLIYWNVKDGSRFSTIVLGQQNHTSTTIAYERGKIYDRSGNILATNEKVYTLVLEPKNIVQNNTSPRETLDATVNALVKYLNLDEKKLRDKIVRNKNSYYVVYKEENKELTYEQVEAFNEFVEKKDQSFDAGTPDAVKAEILQARHVTGVMFEESFRRIYPYNTLACRVLGFTSSGNQGNWGIEQQYNSQLNGTDGRSYYYFNEELTQEQTVKEAVDGNSVVSTIDIQIQKIIEDKLKHFDEAVGSKETNILVMDPRTGEVLAMAGSRPYDLNKPMDEANLTMLYSQAEIDKMKAYTRKVEQEKAAEATTEEKKKKKKKDKAEEDTEEEKDEEEKQQTIYDGFYQLWRNAIISDTKEPGSTYKPFTVAAGFESGVLKGNEDYYCDGSKAVGKRRIGCSHVHGAVSLKNAVAKSCNVAMMTIAEKEGADVFYDYQNQFGFGRKTGIDLPGEADTSGLVYNASNYKNDVTLCTNAFGQNFNCSMIQMAAGFASLINGGDYNRPWVVKQIQSSDGDIVMDMDKVTVRSTVSDETSRKLRNYLTETVLTGTGIRAQIPGYSIGGKTGTAEKIPRDKENYYISFMGFAPANDPQVMIYVTIDEPHVDNQATAGPAVDLQRQCMEKILPILDIKPDKKVTQRDLDAYEIHTGHPWDPDANYDADEFQEWIKARKKKEAKEAKEAEKKRQAEEAEKQKQAQEANQAGQPDQGQQTTQPDQSQQTAQPDQGQQAGQANQAQEAGQAGQPENQGNNTEKQEEKQEDKKEQ